MTKRTTFLVIDSERPISPGETAQSPGASRIRLVSERGGMRMARRVAMMRKTSFPDRVQALVRRTANAYSLDRYASWKACAVLLLSRGYSDCQAQAILRSRIMRWAVDASNARYGRATSRDLARCLDRNYPGGVPWLE